VYVCVRVREGGSGDEDLSMFDYYGDTTIYRVFECAVFRLTIHAKKCFCTS
jgi:hypothetical protein